MLRDNCGYHLVVLLNNCFLFTNLESSDDRYLSANDDGDEDDLNSEASSGGVIPGILPQYLVGFRGPYSNQTFNQNFHHNIAGVYQNNMMTKSATGVKAISTGPGSSGPGSPYRNV